MTTTDANTAQAQTFSVNAVKQDMDYALSPMAALTDRDLHNLDASLTPSASPNEVDWPAAARAGIEQARLAPLGIEASRWRWAKAQAGIASDCLAKRARQLADIYPERSGVLYDLALQTHNAGPHSPVARRLASAAPEPSAAFGLLIVEAPSDDEEDLDILIERLCRARGHLTAPPPEAEDYAPFSARAHSEIERVAFAALEGWGQPSMSAEAARQSFVDDLITGSPRAGADEQPAERFRHALAKCPDTTEAAVRLVLTAHWGRSNGWVTPDWMAAARLEHCVLHHAREHLLGWEDEAVMGDEASDDDALGPPARLSALNRSGPAEPSL